MRRFLLTYAEKGLGIGLPALMALGRQNPGDSTESFNMAYLAIRGSGSVNGVSRLHGQVSRRIFQSLYPGWPEAEVPIAHVTRWDSLAGSPPTSGQIYCYPTRSGCSAS